MEKNLFQPNTFHCKKRLIPFVKEPILDSNENVIMRVSTKLSWVPKFKFLVGEAPLYSAILKIATGNILKKQFIICDKSSNEIVAVVSEKSLHKKKSIFTEYDIVVGENKYKAKYEPMYKGFSITDVNDQLCVTGVKADFIISNFLKKRSYYVEIHNKEHDKLVWLAVVKGMQFLE